MKEFWTGLVFWAVAAGGALGVEEYYAGCFGADGRLLDGAELKSALCRISREHARPGGARGRIDSFLRAVDACPTNAGMAQCVYSSRGTTNATREHAWPVSHGARGKMKSDLHNLRLADRRMNEARGRRDFGDCRGRDWAMETNGCWMTWNAWEPPDESKGNLARAAMYMAVRYGEGENALELVDEEWTGGRQLGRLSTLLVWNEIDPVDEAERRRNELICERQGNRNPFVDHPEWARAVFEGTMETEAGAKAELPGRERDGGGAETSGVEIRGLEARQRYPWNGLVDIDYTVETGAEGERAALAVRGVDGERGETVEMRSLEGDGAEGPVGAGTRRLTWNLGADAPGLVSDAFSVEMRAWLAGGEYLAVDMSGGREASSWPVERLDGVPEGGWPEEYKTGKLVLRRVPAGRFAMGSPGDETGRRADETRHETVLSEPYYLGVFEVTQAQWELATGENPSEHKGATRPVEMVSYEMVRGAKAGAEWPSGRAVDAGSFLGVLREKTGLAFDLPTEAQWERACRAGTETALNSGRNLTGWNVCGALAVLGRYCYNGGLAGESDGKGGHDSAHTAVGCYEPNAWGLYDMHGNVWEWCLDWYGAYGEGAATDPVGAAAGTSRVIRGGGWYALASECRSAGRHEREPGYARCGGGFRVACAAGAGGASGWAGCAEWTDTVELSGWLGAEWADWDDGAAEWRVVSGPGEIRDGKLGFSGMGEVVVAGTLPGRGGVADCSVARTVTVGKASARVVLEGAAVQEAGRVEGWGVRTEPEGLAVEVRHDGGEAVPQEAGWHAVEAEVADERYKGRAAGTLVAVEPGRYLAVDLSGGTEAEYWPWTVLEGMPEGGWTEEYKTDKLVLRWVEPGSFTMGSPEDETGRGGDEQAHAVTLTKGVWMGVFEVTQRQMELVVGKTNFAYKIGSLPASGVSYDAVRGASSGAGWPADDAVDEGSFFGVLRAKTGLAFDLPTEAEWEYACRAGTATALNSGKDLDGTSWREANAAEVGRYRYNSGFSGAGDGRGVEKGVAAAGSYLPNAWGLHDMHGNLREWCLDWYGAYREGAAADPAGAPEGTARTFRGGSFCDEAAGVRSARRGRMSPKGWSWETGFRVVCHGEAREETAP